MASEAAPPATSKQAITALLTEHFRYTPLTLLDDIINTVNELVYRAVTAVEEGLNGAPAASLGFADRAAAENRRQDLDEEGNPVFPEARDEIENGVHQLETLLESTVDKNFDKLEIYALRNILTVPEDLAPWMRLSHYRGLDFNPSVDLSSVESLQLLRKKVKETAKLNKELQVESCRNNSLITQLRSILQGGAQQTDGSTNSTDSLAFLMSEPTAQRLNLESIAASGQQKLQSATAQTVSQLADLQQLHSHLKSKLGKLQAGRLGGDEVERRNYIEAQTRHRLEKDGMDLNSGQGLSRGGYTTAALGRNVGNDEVRAIEQVVDLMGQVREDPAQHK